MPNHNNGNGSELIRKYKERQADHKAGFQALIMSILTFFKNPIVSNANYLMGGNVLNALGGFVFWTIVSRSQTPSNVGLGTATLSAVSFLSGISNLGLGYGILRFLPESRMPHKFLRSVLFFSAFSSAIAAFLYLVGIRFWTPEISFLKTNFFYFAGFILFVSITTLSANLLSTFQARRMAFYTFAYAIIVNIFKVMGGITIIKPGPISIVAAAGASVVIGSCCAYFLFLPKVEPRSHQGFQISFKEIINIMPYSLGNYISFILEFNIQTLVIFIILDILGPAASGYAAISWFIASMVISLGLSWAGSTFAEGNNSPDDAEKIFLKASIPAVGLTFLVALVVGIGAPLWLSFFGKEYATEASGFLRAMCVASPLIVLVNMFLYYFRVKKNMKLVLSIDVFQGVIVILATYLFLAKTGIIIIGISYLVAYGVITVLLGLGALIHRHGRLAL